MNMKFIRKLPIPQEIKDAYPVTEELLAVKAERDKAISDVLTGKSDKILLVIGPCSADNREAVTEYIARLKPLADEVKDRIVTVPRVYTNKPRTAGVGYMGMLHCPDPSGEPDLLKGIVSIRELHLSVLRDFSLTCADELLYPDNYRYLSDLLSYAAVGARSAEDQYHRLAASGLDIPVGMKNPMYGDIGVMVNSVISARSRHAFIYRGWEVVTSGNALAHGVLRGSRINGKDVPNYGYESLVKAADGFEAAGIPPVLIVDANHSNSAGDYNRQADIALDVMNSRNINGTVRAAVRGLMIESYLEDGAQSTFGKVFGKSVTDPCLGWDKTRELIYKIAEKV